MHKILWKRMSSRVSLSPWRGRLRKPTHICLLLVLLGIVLVFGAVIYCAFIAVNHIVYIQLEDEARLSKNKTNEKIPRIIHQTYRDENIPERWVWTHQTVLSMHPNYKHMFWTDSSIRKFIEEEYAWFLPTFDSYPYPIQRADAFRYFVLYHYGGVYVDLDIGAKRPFDALLKYGAIFPKAVPSVGFTNDFMAARKRHPLLRRMIHALPKRNRYLVLPYFTIFYSTGPFFVSSQYHVATEEELVDVRIMSSDMFSDELGLCFRVRGFSWITWDTTLIEWVWQHLREIVIIGTLLVIIVIYERFRKRQELIN